MCSWAGRSEDLLGLRITVGGFPVKAWTRTDGGSTALVFSSGGRGAEV